MDATYFLKKRTDFIRFYYDTSAPAFAEVRRCIDEELPPYDDPPYSEDPEPAYLEEWMDTETAEQILGIACVSLLSDALKQYFHTLQKRVIGFRFEDNRALTKNGFVPAYLEALGEILDTDWSDCPAKLDVIEQIVLARNRGQHGADLMTLDIMHDGKTLEKYPTPFFASSDELKDWPREPGSLSWFVMPRVKITRDNLFEALSEVDTLADWIDSRLDKVREWREAQRMKTEDSK